MLILRRLLGALVTLWLAMSVAFLLARATGDPVRQMLGPEATEERVNEVRTELGLTKSLPLQYVDYMSQLFAGDMGTSTRFGVSNSTLIWGTLPASATLAAAAMAIAILVGLSLGTVAGMQSGSVIDRLATGVAFLGQSTPLFWVGMVLILVFAETLRWLPAGQSGGLIHLLMPALTLSLSPMAKIALLTRSGMRTAMHEDYIMAVRARGIAPWRIVFIHALRNATLPAMTITALQAGAMMSSAVTVELVFSWPGLGQLATQAVLARDFSLVQAIVLVSATIFVGLNLLADLAYTIVDPRIRSA